MKTVENNKDIGNNQPIDISLAFTYILESRIKGEGVIAGARLVICLALFLVIGFVFFFNRTAGTGIPESFSPAMIVEIICIIVSVFISLWVLKKVKQKKYYNWMPYIFPFIDVTFLNIINYFNAVPQNSLVITGAPVFLYIVFLVLTSLRNSVSSVIFTGAYISVSYILISVFHVLIPLRVFDLAGGVFINQYGFTVTTPLDDEILKPVIFLMITGFLAFLAHKVKRIFIDQTNMRIEKEKIRGKFTESLIDATAKITGSSSALLSASKLFTGNIELLLENTKQIDDAIRIAFSVMEETSATITEMIHSNMSISDSVAKQYKIVEDGAASIEEMQRSITRIAEISKLADDIAKNLFESAKAGETTVADVVNAVIETDAASKKIGDIVEVISGLSKTSNLLAMNASIEAAHAGDAGRGFAVVAEEIRNLSETSSENTLRISNILTEILARIDTIGGLSGQAQIKLEDISIDAGKSAGINSEMLAAVQEESVCVQTAFTSFRNLLSVTGEVKGASDEQASGGNRILAAVRTLKAKADEVTALVGKQTVECSLIGEHTRELNRILANNSQVIEKLGQLVEEI